VEATDGWTVSNKREFKPDVICMDLVMPVMDGFEATRQIRMSPDLKEVVVITLWSVFFYFDQQTSREAVVTVLSPSQSGKSFYNSYVFT